MSQAAQNVVVLYRLQWSNGKVRKERYYVNLDTARVAYQLLIDALPNEDWCRLSIMEDSGVSGYVEKEVIEYSE